MRSVSVAIFMVIALLAVACARGAATPTLPQETVLPPTATPQPTATPEPTPTATVVPTPLPTATPDLSIFGRTRELLESLEPEVYFSDEGLQQILEALSADVADYLDANLDLTLPLAEQAQALERLRAALPGFEGGKVVPAELDGLPPEELFVVPNMNGGPLLLFRHEETGYTAYPILAKWAALDKPVASAPNIWPYSAQAIDATGDGHAEALVVHTHGGASFVGYLVQILRWKGDGFEVLFQAELVDWAGPSTWKLEPDLDGGQLVHLTYPVFLPGHYPKAGINPQGEQFWRWDEEAGRYRLAWQTVEPSVMGPAELGQAEEAFEGADYTVAIPLYEAFLANEAWQKDFLKDYTGALPGVGQRELDAWLDLARLRRGLSLALSGHVEDAQIALGEVEKTELLAEVAQLFLEAYGPAGDMLAGLAAYERRLAAGPSDELVGELDRPAAVYYAFLPQPTLVQTALTQIDPKELTATLDAVDAPLAGLTVSDLDGDGSAEVVWLSPPTWHAYAPNKTPVGNWQQAWVAWDDGDRWRVTGVAAADRIELLGVTPQDPQGRLGIQLRLIDPEQARHVTLFWDGEVKRPWAPAQPQEWPVLGW